MAEDRLVQPIIFCFCGPAGSGKSTICQKMVADDQSLQISISTTTRSPRKNEVDGVHYFFVDEKEFLRRVEQGLFIEHAVFGDQRYGTEKRNLEKAAARGADLVLDVDVQGVEQMKQLFADSLVTIFVFPPSFETLVERLSKRGTESPERVQRRLEIAEREMQVLSQPGFADYLLINDQEEQAAQTARSIIDAERCRYKRQESEYLAKLLSAK